MLDIKQLEYILDKQLGWIAAADTRLSLILLISTAMLGSMAVHAPKPSSWTILMAIPTSFAIFFLCLSIIFSACASFPRTSGTKGSLIFFDGINSRDINQFISAITSAQESDFREDLIRQCHINAQIALSKFIWVKRGLSSLFFAMPPWALSIYALYGMTDGSI